MKEAAIFWVFLRMGFVGFGSGPSMIPLMQEEAVDRQGWMTAELFTNALAACNALPGPIATKMAFYIGNHHGGIAGGLLALAGVLLPSTLAVAAAGAALLKLQRWPPGERFLMGVRPAVVALLLTLAWDLAPSSLRGIRPALLGILVFACVAFLKVHPALALVASGVLGVLLFR